LSRVVAEVKSGAKNLPVDNPDPLGEAQEAGSEVG
jgi:hypothetical protein